jgi:uncharacterized membrane protein
MKKDRKKIIISIISIIVLSLIVSIVTNVWGYFVCGLLPLFIAGMYYFLELKEYVKNYKL